MSLNETIQRNKGIGVAVQRMPCKRLPVHHWNKGGTKEEIQLEETTIFVGTTTGVEAKNSLLGSQEDKEEI